MKTKNIYFAYRSFWPELETGQKFHESGCEFRDPEGKYSAHFYPNILRHGKFDPEFTVMIGDEPIRDMIPAMKAGIKYGVNVDRKQKKISCITCNSNLIFRNL